MGKRVPHCSECERCQYTNCAYKSYYCCEENEPYTVYNLLCVDTPPKTSPKWCPKRKIKEEH